MATASIINSSSWTHKEDRIKKSPKTADQRKKAEKAPHNNCCIYWVLWICGLSQFTLEEFWILTFPFSNLLTLFLQLTSQRSPVSPCSPIRLRKTEASVPLPLTFPVHTVTLYLTTGTQNRPAIRPPGQITGQTVDHSRASTDAERTRQGFRDELSAGRQLPHDLVVVLVGVQPTFAGELVLLLRQGLHQSCLMANTHDAAESDAFIHRASFVFSSLHLTQNPFLRPKRIHFSNSQLTLLRCHPEKGFLFSCQIRNLNSFPKSGSSTCK